MRGINIQIIILNIKQIKMKKVILALAVVSFAFAACNNDGEAKTEVKTDSPKVEAPATPDTAAAKPVDTAAAPKADTAAAKK
jgi:hypothetical protein